MTAETMTAFVGAFMLGAMVGTGALLFMQGCARGMERDRERYLMASLVEMRRQIDVDMRLFRLHRAETDEIQTMIDRADFAIAYSKEGAGANP